MGMLITTVRSLEGSLSDFLALGDGGRHYEDISQALSGGVREKHRYRILAKQEGILLHFSDPELVLRFVSLNQWQQFDFARCVMEAFKESAIARVLVRIEWSQNKYRHIEITGTELKEFFFRLV